MYADSPIFLFRGIEKYIGGFLCIFGAQEMCVNLHKNRLFF